MYQKYKIRLLRSFWKKFPRAIQRLILSIFSPVVASVLLKRRKIDKGPLTIAGLMRSATGLGEGARQHLFASKNSGIDTRYTDIGKWFPWLSEINIDLGKESTICSGGIVVMHINPLELGMVIPLLGKNYFKHKRIVGYWAWELSYLPLEWRRAVNIVDEIWVPSGFIADALSPFTGNEIKIIPHPVQTPVPLQVGRSYFGIPEGVFVVLMMFDMRSCAARKNPFDAIKAFKMAFGGSEDACLIVKVGTPDESKEIMRAIQAEIQGKNNIRLFFGRLDKDEQASLIDSVDVYISLHRSEGFGLVLAEAMLLGKPVIATGYSGNMDFMSPENSAVIGYELIPVNDPQNIYSFEGALWAQPVIQEAADWLMRFYKNKNLRHTLGEKAKESARNIFDIKSYNKAVIDTIGDYYEWPVNKPLNDQRSQY